MCAVAYVFMGGVGYVCVSLYLCIVVFVYCCICLVLYLSVVEYVCRCKCMSLYMCAVAYVFMGGVG